MNNEIDEQWLSMPRVRNCEGDIVAISNTGKYRRGSSIEGILDIRQRVMYYGKREHCSHIIAEHFLITVKRPDQKFIDHITHHPTEYNVNDVRNLRWCTLAENNGFEEARENTSKAMKGLRIGDKNPIWKGDNVGPCRLYQRALIQYRNGEITKEELQPYRDKSNEYKRARKKQSGGQSSVNH